LADLRRDAPQYRCSALKVFIDPKSKSPMQARTHLTKADEKNVYSQYGEDGVLERIFSTLGLKFGIAAEFGAWDGVHLSNTARLRERGWHTILIEADQTHLEQLRRLENEKTRVVHAFLEPKGDRSLDTVLDQLGFSDLDFVSIDIDGDDVNIFRQLLRQPTVVCIEFNPGIAPPYVFFNPERTHKGSSIAAIHQLAQEKGYQLVYATYCNAFFVREPEADLFHQYDACTAFHLTRRPAIAYMFDGEFRIHSGETDSLLRHPVSTVPVYVPRLPRVLLGWPPTRLKVATMYLYCSVAAPAFYLWQFLRESARQLWRRPHATLER
jgi:hypothetical protein